LGIVRPIPQIVEPSNGISVSVRDDQRVDGSHIELWEQLDRRLVKELPSVDYNIARTPVAEFALDK
jgi:hypothetical protein